jgi:hypothetical protein
MGILNQDNPSPTRSSRWVPHEHTEALQLDTTSCVGLRVILHMTVKIDLLPRKEWNESLPGSCAIIREFPSPT